MNRRDFVRTAALGSAVFSISRRARAFAFTDAPSWRTFEVTTRLDVTRSRGAVRAWVPVPLLLATAYQRPLGNTFDAGHGTARLVKNNTRGYALVAAEWPDGQAASITLTSRVQTRDIGVDLARPGRAVAPGASVARFLRPSALIPSDGIVKDTASAITRGAKTDLEKARAIYDWVVENTVRDPAVRGCGRGDIRAMLETKNLGGKCADLNALYVGLAHAAGLPARDAYGLRVAKSELGYKSLGLSSDIASKAQHCRAEVYLAEFGWVPVDPADVRKVVLEEPPGHLDLDADPVRRARQRLFGSWEMNWIAYNFEHDLALPGSTRGALPFLMYPQAETAAGALDSLDPDTFKYTITARQVA